ncbi:MAG: hypothetical protein CND89_05370 [Marine Group II euryarchaeote MED-G38]|nr:MAG: hypothetical protein CND89_05370 [Marine Group II euryarchaeote MED-G38]
MPRKRASKLRHTPFDYPFDGDHLRRMEYDHVGRGVEMVSISKIPSMPDGLIKEIKSLLKGKNAPFLNHLSKEVKLIWTDEGESRLGFTRFECNHNELFRRRRLKLSPGPIIIALNPILNRDESLYLHTLVHELLHAAGLTDHNGEHSSLVSKIAPAPKLKDSKILRELRQQVLEKLPERQWICGDCGHTWDRRRVSTPTRCPKCAKFFKIK